jgi:hypothetical protein
LDWLLAHFSPNADRGRKLYAEFVADGIAMRGG